MFLHHIITCIKEISNIDIELVLKKLHILKNPNDYIHRFETNYQMSSVNDTAIADWFVKENITVHMVIPKNGSSNMIIFDILNLQTETVSKTRVVIF